MLPPFILSNGTIASFWYICSSILGIGISMISNFVFKIFTFKIYTIIKEETQNLICLNRLNSENKHNKERVIIEHTICRIMQICIIEGTKLRTKLIGDEIFLISYLVL